MPCRVQVCILAAAGLILIGCNNDPPAPPVKESVEFFNAPKPPPEPPEEQLPQVRLYVDDSESMQGYVAGGDSIYGATIERLMERLAEAQYPLKSSGLSGNERSLDSLPASRLRDPGFYVGGDTPLSKVVGQMADAVERGSVAVLVSDMVQSDPLAERTDLIRALAKLAGSNGNILLIGCRSGFRGKYFVETYPKSVINLSLPNDEAQGRPFYYLVGAPSAMAMQKFRDKVLTPVFEGHQPQTFTPSMAALSFGTDWKILGVGQAESVWSRKTRAALVPGTRGVLWESFLHQGGNGPDAPMRIESEISIRSPLRDLSRLGYTIDRGTFRTRGKAGKPEHGEARERVERRPDCEVQIAQSGQNPQVKKWAKCSEAKTLPNGDYPIRLTFPFATPAMSTWDVYRLKITAGDGNLRPPEWISEWSTGSDRQVQDGNKTLYLEVLGESLVNGISENIVILDRLIHLGRF